MNPTLFLNTSQVFFSQLGKKADEYLKNDSRLKMRFKVERGKPSLVGTKIVKKFRQKSPKNMDCKRIESDTVHHSTTSLNDDKNSNEVDVQSFVQRPSGNTNKQQMQRTNSMVSVRIRSENSEGATARHHQQLCKLRSSVR